MHKSILLHSQGCHSRSITKTISKNKRINRRCAMAPPTVGKRPQFEALDGGSPGAGCSRWAFVRGEGPRGRRAGACGVPPASSRDIRGPGAGLRPRPPPLASLAKLAPATQGNSVAFLATTVPKYPFFVCWYYTMHFFVWRNTKAVSYRF